MSTFEHKLTPTQSVAFHKLLTGLDKGQIGSLKGGTGSGKSSILRALHAKRGGALVGMTEFTRALQARSPEAIEEAYIDVLETALSAHDLVIVDDLHLIVTMVSHYDYPRGGVLDAMLTGLLERLGSRRLVFASATTTPHSVWQRAFRIRIKPSTPADYQALCRAYLGDRADSLDFDEIHGSGPKLNGHQLHQACQWLAREERLTTARFIEFLQKHHMVSNVKLEEVAPVDLAALKGVDDVVRALETKVALPFENHALAAEFALKPKRGVLLAGPPGTGKTTIGRALARRLKSKFFLIDGTVVAGSSNFYCKVGDIFEEAKRNAPAVVFIDDADVIFEQSEDRGFFRYLLTLLDGLESASTEGVCVMMTAMEPGSLPPALVRSGRIELWLETRLPDESARRSIFRDRIGGLPPPVRDADTALLASASRGLTGADIKAVVEDAKLLYAADVVAQKTVRGEAARPVEDYFIEAIDTVRANGRKYAQRKPLRLAGAGRLGFLDLEEMAGD